MPDISELKFVRTFDFRHIPRTLFEQVKEMDADMIDRVYRFGQLIGASPLTLLYVLTNDVYEIKGVLWAGIDPVEAIIRVRVFSVVPEYQSAWRLLNKIKDFLFNLPTSPELKKELRFTTTKPDAFKRLGARRTDEVLMEVKQNGESIKTAEPDNKSL